MNEQQGQAIELNVFIPFSEILEGEKILEGSPPFSL
jgi:hypothetical protein